MTCSFRTCEILTPRIVFFIIYSERLWNGFLLTPWFWIEIFPPLKARHSSLPWYLIHNCQETKLIYMPFPSTCVRRRTKQTNQEFDLCSPNPFSVLISITLAVEYQHMRIDFSMFFLCVFFFILFLSFIPQWRLDFIRYDAKVFGQTKP